MLVYTQAQTELEIDEILTLQGQNLPKNLSPKEIQSEGFLTVGHNLELLPSLTGVKAYLEIYTRVCDVLPKITLI